MGLSDEEGYDNETSQQMYYGTVWFYRNYGTPEQLAKYTAGGPPPPEPADGIIGKILWHEHHRATVEELTAILEQMREEGLVTDTGPRAYTGPVPPADIADLKAHMIEHPHQPMDTKQPANSGDTSE
ncbi:hypothetical protein [Nocardia sp. NPDC004604]|uniref:hypothetical protein n=1 Tax=Nocardia sp. NPDC004604 TaxID=3157013 RepID=UPI0033A989B7